MARLMRQGLGPEWVIPLVAVAAVVGVVYLPQTPAWDLDAYMVAAHSWWHGAAVYPPVGSAAVFSGSAFVYPFVTLWPYLALAVLPHGLAVGITYAVTTAAIVLAVRAVGVRMWPPVVLVLLTAFVITGLQLGNLSPWLLVGALLLWRLRDRPWLFGLVAGAAVAAKLVLVPMLAWPLITRRWKAAAVGVAATFGLLALSFLTGPIGPREYVRILRSLGDHEAAQGIGLLSALRRVGLGAGLAQAVALAVAAVVLALVWLHFQRRGDETVVYAGAVVATVLVTPVLWSHYLALLAAPLLVRRESVARLAIFAAASWALAPPHGSTPWSIAAGLAGVAACAWCGTPARRPALPVPALAAAAGAVLLIATVIALLAGNGRAAGLGLSSWLGVAFAVAVLLTSAREPERTSRWDLR